MNRIAITFISYLKNLVKADVLKKLYNCVQIFFLIFFKKSEKKFGGMVKNDLSLQRETKQSHCSVSNVGLVAQLDRVSDYGSEGFRFDS
ncbi:MAG: hypothetical protein RIS64_1998 [Bacteroidota bacterium]